MGGACIVVDVQTIGLVVDNIGVCTESIKDRFCNVPAGAVGTIQTNLDTFERVNTQRNQVAHVTVTTRHIVHGTADVLTMSKRQLWPVLIKYMKLTVNVIFNQQQRFFRHLLTIAVNQLDAVVVIRIVAGRDHDAAVKIIHASDVSHGRGRGDVEQVSVCAGGRQACHQAVLEHIRAAAGVLADDDASGIGVTVALAQSIIVPAQETAHLIGMVCG